MSMKRIVGWLLLLVCVLLVVVLVRVMNAPKPVSVAQAANEPSAEEAESRPKREVLIARRDLAAGERLSEYDVRWQRVSIPGYQWIFKDRGDLEPQSLADFSGGVMTQAVKAGELIAFDQLIRTDQPGFLAAALAPGMRAVSIPVDDVSASSGLVKAGDWVDLILTFYTDSTKGEWSVQKGGDIQMLANKLLARNIKVVAINSHDLSAVGDSHQHEGHNHDHAHDGASSDSFEPATTATLEVLPKQAQLLKLASRMGVVSLSLRSRINPEESDGELELRSRDVHNAINQIKPEPGLVLMRGSETQVVGYSQQDDNSNNNEDGHDHEH